MTWLIVCLSVSVFVAVGISVGRLNQVEKSAAARELNEAAETFGLIPQPQTFWSSDKVFRGTTQGLEVTWTLTPQSIGRVVRIRIRGATPESAAEVSYEDKHNDSSQLVPATRKLLERVISSR